MPTRIASQAFSRYLVRTEPGQRDRLMREVEEKLLAINPGRIVRDLESVQSIRDDSYRGDEAMMSILIAVMAVPNVVLLIPKFLVIKQLGIYDTYTAMIVPLLVDAAGVFIMKNFFEGIPVSV